MREEGGDGRGGDEGEVTVPEVKADKRSGEDREADVRAPELEGMTYVDDAREIKDNFTSETDEA